MPTALSAQERPGRIIPGYTGRLTVSVAVVVVGKAVLVVIHSGSWV